MGAFFVKRNDQLFGPATVDELVNAASTGLILPTDLIGPSVDGPWRDAGRCAELSFERQEAPVYFWEGELRRGPISLDQLSRLLEWNVIAYDTQAYSEPGGFTCVGELLGLKPTPDHRDGSGDNADAAVDAASSAKVQTAPIATAETSSRDGSDSCKTTTPGSKTPQRDNPARESEKSPRRRSDKPQVKSSAPSRFELLIQMEQDAERDDSPAQASRKRGKKQPFPAGRSDVTGRRRRTQGDPSYFRAVNLIFNSPSFAGSYRFFAIMLTIQAACFLAPFAAIAGTYFLRIVHLATETSGSAGGRLGAADRVEACFACAMIAAEVGLPLVFLIRDKLPVVCWAGATAAGLLMFPLISPNAAALLANVLGFVVLGCGVALAFALWSIAVLKWNVRLVVTFSVGAFATGALAGFLAVVRVSNMFRHHVDDLPPVLESIEPASSMVLLILCVQWIVGPVLVGRILRENTNASTRRYIDSRLRGAGICIAAAWLLHLLCARPVEINFVSVPVVLLSWTALAIVASVMQSALWKLSPELIRRK